MLYILSILLLYHIYNLPVPAQPPLPGRGVGPPGHHPWPRVSVLAAVFGSDIVSSNFFWFPAKKLLPRLLF